MDFFLDNLLDTFRVLTFQRTPLYKDWRHVIPGERLETFGVEYAEKPAGRVPQFHGFAIGLFILGLIAGRFLCIFRFIELMNSAALGPTSNSKRRASDSNQVSIDSGR